MQTEVIVSRGNRVQHHVWNRGDPVVVYDSRRMKAFWWRVIRMLYAKCPRARGAMVAFGLHVIETIESP